MTRKVIFFTTGMTAGGAERVIATLANDLAERGFDVTIGMVKGEGSAYQLAPTVSLVSANLSPGLRNLPRALSFYHRLIKRSRPDAVASFSTKSDIIALLSKLLLRTNAWLIISERADPNTRGRLMQLACNFLYRWSDGLVCQSEAVASYYRRECASVSTAVIPNPLSDISIAEPVLGQRKALVFSAGRLAPQKNHNLSIAAFKKIRVAFPHMRLKIFGEGPLDGELQSLIQDEQLEDVVMLEGVVPNVIREYADASLFLFASEFEGFPNALLEAAASGIPSVTTDFSPGTACEIIQEGVNGYIVPIGDGHALAEAAIKVLSGSLDQNELVAEAQRIRQRHETSEVVDAWLEIFESK